jgi:dCTP deaminase
MILCDRDIRKALATKTIEIDPMLDSQIGPTSIDLRLGALLLRYTTERIELGRTHPETTEVEICPQNGYCLGPGEFVLGCTLERVHLSNGYQGFIETKGDVARAGLQVHNCDGHVDPGSNHHITLEISNQNVVPVVLYPAVLICQIFIHTLSGPCDKVYQGKYFGQSKPTTYRPS